MSPAERAELRRRYDDFVRHFGGGTSRHSAPKKSRLRKWAPGAKR